MTAALLLSPEPVQGHQTSLNSRVYDALRTRLIRGHFEPGEAVSIRATATSLGTSAMPVRDALSRLIGENALEMINRTIVVPHMTRERFQEILRVRLALEPMAAQRAAERISRGSIEELVDLNGKMTQAATDRNRDRYYDLNYQFHFVIYAAAALNVSLPFILSLWMQVGPFLHAAFRKLEFPYGTSTHDDIIKALRRADPEEAGKGIELDIRRAADLLLALGEF